VSSLYLVSGEERSRGGEEEKRRSGEGEKERRGEEEKTRRREEEKGEVVVLDVLMRATVLEPRKGRTNAHQKSPEGVI
jgi:hypothetical protein